MAFTAANGRTQIALADINITPLGGRSAGAADYFYGDRSRVAIRN